MEWKEWISVCFELVVRGTPHDIIVKEENTLSRNGTWKGVKIGEA